MLPGKLWCEGVLLAKVSTMACRTVEDTSMPHGLVSLEASRPARAAAEII